MRITSDQVTWLENAIDTHNADLEPLDSFILPGGSSAAAHLHLARSIVRRAERRVVALAFTKDPVNPEVIRYLNRLSDFLFVAARIANNKGQDDVKWVPGANRAD